jgi:hypothetical protein
MTSHATALEGARNPVVDRVPPHVFFVVSAIFHYLARALAGTGRFFTGRSARRACRRSTRAISDVERLSG